MTFIQQLIKESKPAPYPLELEKVAGSLAIRYQGVWMVLDLCESYAYIVRIRVPKKRQGKGLGGAALKWLCRTADQHKISLQLHPSTGDCRMTNKALRAWYHRNCFRPLKSGMVREPSA